MGDEAQEFGVLKVAVEVLDAIRELALLLTAMQYGGLVAALDQLAHDVGAAQPGATDYQDSHVTTFYDG
jgi:hypothetical protein